MGKLKELFRPRSGEKLQKHRRSISSSEPSSQPDPQQTRVLSALVTSDRAEAGDAYRAPTTEALDESWTDVPFTKRSSAPAPTEDESQLASVQRDLKSLDLNRSRTGQQYDATTSSDSDRSTSVYHDTASGGHRAADDVSPVRHDAPEAVLNREIPVQDQGRRTSISRKPIGDGSADQGQLQQRRTSISRKPIGDGAIQAEHSHSSPSHNNFNTPSAAQQESLKGVVDLTNTTDTTFHESTAPAATQETIHPHVHHVREEVVTREIHTHDVFHRIQPVIDVRVLPARHFVPSATTGELVEIPAESVPGRKGNWAVVQAPLREEGTLEDGKPKFEEDYDFVDEEGVRRSRKTEWQEPVLEEGGRLTGQTQEVVV